MCRSTSSRPISSVISPTNRWWRGRRRQAYIASRFIRRHRLGLAAGLLVFAALVGGIIGTTIQAQRANREALAAEQVADFLISVFEVSSPMQSRGEDVTARELLDRGAERLETELAGQPLVRARLANTMGSVYRQLGIYDEAAQLTEAALTTTRKELGHRNIGVAKLSYNLALIYCDEGRFTDAEPVLLEAREISLKAPDGEQTLADVLGLLGSLYAAQHRLEEAQSTTQSTLPLFDRLGDDRGKAQALSVLAAIAAMNQDHETSVKYSEECIEIAQRTFDPSDPQLASYRQNLALTYGRLGRLDDRERILEEVIASLETTLDDGHPNLARIRANLAYTWFDMGRDEEAEALLRRSITDLEERLGADHIDTAIALNNLGGYICEDDRADEALEVLRESVGIFEAGFGPDNARTAMALDELRSCLSYLGRDGEAAEIEARINRSHKPED